MLITLFELVYLHIVSNKTKLTGNVRRAEIRRSFKTKNVFFFLRRNSKYTQAKYFILNINL